MKLKKTALAIAIVATMPWMHAYAQSPVDMQKQILLLQEQLKALQSQVEAMGARQAVDPTEFNRMVQKMEVKEEAAQKSGFSDLTIKGTIEARYLNDRVDATGFSGSGLTGSSSGFTAGNGYSGVGMLEIAKQAEGGNGINWMLRLTPGGGVRDDSKLVNEASISVPVGEGSTRVIAGLIPDWTGYEFYFANQNPLITHNLLFNHTAATSYLGAGLQHSLGSVTLKGMLANVDGAGNTQTSPGLVYNAYWTINEFSYLNFSGVNVRGKTSNGGAPISTVAKQATDLFEFDGGYTRGDLALNGQLSFGKIKAGASNGGDATWWGISAFSGYKITPRLQAIARYDFINNRKNGGGIYGPSGTIFGPELDDTGTATDPDRGTTRSALSLGANYAINPSTQWKYELRFDRSSGYNFINAEGALKKSNTTFGTSLVVSF